METRRPSYADPYRLVDLEGDPAHGVHDLFDAAEVHDHIAVDGDAGKVLDRLGGEVGAASGEGGVDLVLPNVRYVHERVPRDGEHPTARLRHDDGVGARGPAGRRVTSQQQRPLRPEGQEEIRQHERKSEQQHEQRRPQETAATPPLRVPSRFEDLHAHGWTSNTWRGVVDGRAIRAG